MKNVTAANFTNDVAKLCRSEKLLNMTLGCFGIAVSRYKVFSVFSGTVDGWLKNTVQKKWCDILETMPSVSFIKN